jgi:hypothetical protein
VRAAAAVKEKRKILLRNIYAQIKCEGESISCDSLTHFACEKTVGVQANDEQLVWKRRKEKEHNFPIALVFHFFTVFFCVVDFPSLLLVLPIAMCFSFFSTAGTKVIV